MGHPPYFIARGDKHPMWKGDKVGYQEVHRWRRKESGYIPLCDHCGVIGKYIPCVRANKVTQRWSIEWANISGEYKRERSDWLALCRSCHRKYDYEKEKNKKDNLVYA